MSVCKGGVLYFPEYLRLASGNPFRSPDDLLQPPWMVGKQIRIGLRAKGDGWDLPGRSGVLRVHSLADKLPTLMD